MLARNWEHSLISREDILDGLDLNFADYVKFSKVQGKEYVISRFDWSIFECIGKELKKVGKLKQNILAYVIKDPKLIIEELHL